MNRAVHVSNRTFEAEVLGAQEPVVVNWHALGTDPVSRLVSPLLDELVDRFEGNVKYVKVDAQDEFELAYRWGVRRVPALGFFREGKMVGPATPVGSLDYLVAKLEQLTTTPPQALPEAVLDPQLPEATGGETAAA